MTENEIKEKLKELTLEEKAIMCAQTVDFSSGRLYAGRAARLGIQGLVHCDSAGGDMGESRVMPEEERKRTHHATTFPHMAALAATWDEELVRQVGRASGNEARANGVTLLIRPGVNIKRSPLCGRNFEYFSEDPYLTGELAGAYIQGVQSTHTAACVKHYAVNNHEYERMTTNAVVSERALREIYLEAFRIAIGKGNPWSLMTSYNRVNGEWCSSSPHMMTDILRKEWGYQGMVQSDGFAVHTNKVASHLCGMDLEGNEYHEHTGELLEAIYRGQISLKRVDEICALLLRTMAKVEGPEVVADYEQGHQLAIRAEEEAAVLLKNDDVLPLRAEAAGLAFIGAIAEFPPYCGGGSGHSNARTLDSALACIREITGAGFRYAKGYPNVGDMCADDENLRREAVQIAREADTAVLFVGLPTPLETENEDRTTLALPLGQDKLIREVCQVNPNVVLCVHAGSAVDLTPYAEQVKGILFFWLGGEGVGTACANVLFGLAEPGGRLSETFPLRLEDTPAFLSFPRYPSNMHDVLYGEDIYVGYRWYEARKLPVAYPFGFGLSYTSFVMSDLRILDEESTSGDRLHIAVNVQNTGKRAGSQVVQVYVRDARHAAPRPDKELKGFAKVHLKAGESRDVEVTLSDHAFSFWNDNTKQWCVEQGAFEICVGDSSQNILLKHTLWVHSNDRYMMFTEFTPVEWICKSKRLVEACQGMPESVLRTIYGARDMFCAFPVYRLLRPQIGLEPLTREQLDTLLYRLNTLPEDYETD